MNDFIKFLKSVYNSVKCLYRSYTKSYYTEGTIGHGWYSQTPHRLWVVEFFRYRISSKTVLSIFSCFAHFRFRFLNLHRGRKIFYTGENLGHGSIAPYASLHHDHYINDVDLALGFEFRSESNYYRFPLWIMYLFPYNVSFEDIKKRITQINDSNFRLNRDRTEFACLIANHDTTGIRSRLGDLLTPLHPGGGVSYAGSFRRNTGDLQAKYCDDKMEYMRNFRFNICPENTLGEGYITEKIIQSISSGCIPIYWGAYLEPGILNPDAILRYEEGKENELYEKVRTLWKDEEAYRQFVEIPPFVDGAAERIWEMIQGLETKLRAIIKE